MQDLFIEFLPPWVETGLQPAFYDRESGTVLQQTARMYAKVNELVKAVNGMDKIIKECVEYIDHYFENLDVQEEINNKLDAMAEGGELAEFIAQYANLPCVHAYDTIADMASSANLVDGSFARAMSKTVAGTGDGAYYKIRETVEGDDPDGENLVTITGTTLVAEIIPEQPTIKAYSTVADMVADENIIAGVIAETSGFYTTGDKGNAEYFIANNGTANGHSIISLNNGLKAHLIITPSTTVNQYGAYGDGVHDDYSAIQFAIEDNLHGTVKFADCTYAIGTTLQTYADNERKTNLLFEPTSTLKALSSMDALIEIGGLGGTSDGTTDRSRFIKGGIFDATNCVSAIEINRNAMGIIIDGITINRAGTYGIYMPESVDNYPSDVSIRDSYINCTSSAYNTTAIRCERTDNKFENLRLNNCRCAFYFTEGGQYLINCHAMGVGPADPAWYEGTEYMHLVKGGGNYLTNCYCDTLQTFVNNESTGMVTMMGCFYFSYISDVDSKIFKLDAEAPNMKVVNCQFNVPTPDTVHSGFTFGHFNAQTTVHNIYLNDNYISKPDNFIGGDLLLNQNSTQLYWTDNNNLSTSQWTKIGYITAGNVYHNLQFDIAGKVFDAHFRLNFTGGTTYLTKKSATKSDENLTIEVGVKYDNNTNGNTAYALYVRQVSGTTLPADITVNNFNTTNKFVPATRQLKNVPLITETMDASFTV